MNFRAVGEILWTWLEGDLHAAVPNKLQRLGNILDQLRFEFDRNHLVGAGLLAQYFHLAEANEQTER